ncbi:MAG: hypothetical protein RhofKO_24240 [Rhodothermales bacterium]
MNDYSFITRIMLTPDQRIDAILTAAEACFVRRGFHATTIQDIAQEAAISQGLMYRYFKGKAHLIIALVERYVYTVQRAIEQAPTLDATLDVLFREAPDPKSDQHDGILLVEIMAEALRNPDVAEVVRQADAAITVTLADRLTAAQRAGHIAADLDPEATAALLVALGDGLVLHASMADEPTPKALERTLVTLLTRFLAA